MSFVGKNGPPALPTMEHRRLPRDSMCRHDLGGVLLQTLVLDRSRLRAAKSPQMAALQLLRRGA